MTITVFMLEKQQMQVFDAVLFPFGLYYSKQSYFCLFKEPINRAVVGFITNYCFLFHSSAENYSLPKQ